MTGSNLSAWPVLLLVFLLPEQIVASGVMWLAATSNFLIIFGFKVSWISTRLRLGGVMPWRLRCCREERLRSTGNGEDGCLRGQTLLVGARADQAARNQVSDALETDSR